jgi:hypothetical protein
VASFAAAKIQLFGKLEEKLFKKLIFWIASQEIFPKSSKKSIENQ